MEKKKSKDLRDLHAKGFVLLVERKLLMKW
jgi:hypothetical protein